MFPRRVSHVRYCREGKVVARHQSCVLINQSVKIVMSFICLYMSLRHRLSLIPERATSQSNVMLDVDVQHTLQLALSDFL